MSFRWGGAIFLWLLINTNVFAQTKKQKKSYPSSFHRALRIALKKNPSLLAVRAGVQGVRARWKGSLVFPNNPALLVEGGTQSPSVSTGVGGGILPRVNAGLSLALPVGGRWGRKQKWALAEYRWSQFWLKWKEYQTALNVFEAMLRWGMASKKEEKRRAIARAYLKVEALVRKRRAFGTATQLELQLAQTSRMQAQQATLQATLQTRLRKLRVKTLLGMKATQSLPWNVPRIPSLPPLPRQKRFVRRMLYSHPRLRLFKAGIAKSKAALLWSKSRSIPDLTVSLGYSLEDNNHVVRGGLTIPLPIFWKNQSQVGQLRASLTQSRLLLIRQRFLLQQRIHQAYTRYSMALRMNRLLKKQFQAAKARRILVEKGVKEGRFSVFQTLTTQQKILQSELLYLTNLEQGHIHYIRMFGVAGQLPPVQMTNSTRRKATR